VQWKRFKIRVKFKFIYVVSLPLFYKNIKE
jgi:hypothetical protein